MTRDTLLLTAVLLAAGFATPTFADEDPPPAAAEAEPADSDASFRLRVREEQDEPRDKPATYERSDDEIKVFSLQNVAPEEVVPQLQELFSARVMLKAVPSWRMLIARGTAEELEIVEALLLRLDESPKLTRRSDENDPDDDAFRRAAPKSSAIEKAIGIDRETAEPSKRYQEIRAAIEVEISDLAEKYNALMDEGRLAEAYGIAKQAVELDNNNPLAVQMYVESKLAYGSDPNETLGDRGELAEQRKDLWEEFDQPRHRMQKHIREGRHLSVEALRTEFEQLEAKARLLARSKLRTRESDESGAGDVKGLRDAVREAFDARQTLQRRELAELAERLAAIQKSLEARERMKDEIINRRVEELLNPELEWDNVPSRPRRDTTSATRSGEGPISDDSDGIPLAAAIKAFNRRYANHPIGKDQPPLTEKEVVAAIRFWKFKRDEALVSNTEFAAFQRIAETRLLPTGFEFEVIPKFVGLDGETVDAWSVRIRMPAGEPGHTYAFVIRERWVDSRTVPSENDSVPFLGGRNSDRSDALSKRSIAKLKQIMLALLNYHDVFNHFPPATLKGKGNRGKTEHPHSWRVAILPFIGQVELYQQYRFDEPWDSEHNKALLSKMPDVYRSPLDEPDSTHTSYFAVVTPDLETDADGWKRGTLFSNPQGTPMREVTDGTSNTIAIVEAKRAVPWTKPEDIPFDVDGPPPTMGGWFAEGFHAGFADGSAHFLSNENDAQTLRHLLLIQDGHVIEPPKLVK